MEYKVGGARGKKVISDSSIGYSQIVKPIVWWYDVSVLMSYKNTFMIRRLRKKYNHFFAGYEYNKAKKQLLY